MFIKILILILILIHNTRHIIQHKSTIMDYFHVKCNECSEYNKNMYSKAILIDYDDDAIKNIINLNHIIYIEVCIHNKNKINPLLVRSSRMDFTWNDLNNHFRIVNYDYLKLYGKFRVENYIHRNGFAFYEYRSFMEHNIDEFIDKIKKGTIIDCSFSMIKELDEILAMRKTGFTIKRMQQRKSVINIIDTLPFVKHAIK